MSHLKCNPWFTFVQGYDLDDFVSAIRWDRTSTNGRRQRAEVLPYDGSINFEGLITIIITQFMAMQREFSLDNGKLYSSHSKCLSGSAKTAQDKVLS